MDSINSQTLLPIKSLKLFLNLSIFVPSHLLCVHQLQLFIMKFSLTLLSSALLASSILAAPRSERGLAGRLQRRGRTLQGSTKITKDSKNSKTKFSTATGNTSDVEYSSNWSGMAITSPPTGETFNAVSAKFTVPTPSVPSGVDSIDGDYAASAVRALIHCPRCHCPGRNTMLIRCSGWELTATHTATPSFRQA